VKQIDAGLLNVGYADVGPASGPAVVLLHGWPTTFSATDVAPQLAAAGYWVIVPYCAGTAPLRSSPKPRFEMPSNAVALDVIAVMDVSKIEKAILGGFDWGSRTAAIMAALWPERCKAWSP
jgi:pimeloyl-ACP methyl ester carboxylesterase